MPPHMQDHNHSTQVQAALAFFADPSVQSDDGGSGTRVKCVLVGDGAIGKTSLVVSYTTNGYPTEYVPTAFDNYSVVVTVDNQPVRIQLCDTAGQDDFDSLRPLCYPGTDVFLLCFSTVSPTSFHNIVDKWLPEIRTFSVKTPVILVGTQSDLRNDVKVLIELAKYNDQPVLEEEGKRLANQMGALCYIECSALTQQNLKEVFDTALLAALKKNGHFRKSNISVCSATKVKAKKFLKCARKHRDSDVPHSKKGWKKFCCFM